MGFVEKDYQTKHSVHFFTNDIMIVPSTREIPISICINEEQIYQKLYNEKKMSELNKTD